MAADAAVEIAARPIPQEPMVTISPFLSDALQLMNIALFPQVYDYQPWNVQEFRLDRFFTFNISEPSPRRLCARISTHAWR